MRKLKVIARLHQEWNFEIEVSESATVKEIKEIAQEEANERSDQEIFSPRIIVYDEINYNSIICPNCQEKGTILFEPEAIHCTNCKGTFRKDTIFNSTGEHILIQS